MPMAAAARKGRGEFARERIPLLFRAFSDPNRLRILHLLRHGEICVGDLVKVLRVPQARTSRHLAYLRRTGLVHAQKRGLWIYYTLAPARGKVHGTLLDCLKGSFPDLPELAADSKRYDAIKKSGGCCPS